MNLPDWWPIFLLPIAVGGVIAGGILLFPNSANAPCGEGVKVSYGGNPVSNLAIRSMDQSSIWASTDNQGMAVMPWCTDNAVVSATFLGTVYAITLHPHMIEGVSLGP